ncbi:MAG: hypothetical protein GDA49_13020 [Rhodospirillales bacterium]|nr:hypothetical protein [Rhodospirillales bacterium]
MVQCGSLSVEKIVDAAVVMVDRESLDAFSMCKLGADPMALYHHVPRRH